MIGKIDNIISAAVFTERNDTIRTISVRRARNNEKKLFEQKEIS